MPRKTRNGKKRENPNILYPGDTLGIPEKKEKQESGTMEQNHKYKTKHKKLMLRFVLKDQNHNLLVNKKCVLHVKVQQFEITSQADS